MNPDCAVGKHDACNGDAWDLETDAPCRCRCECHYPDFILPTVHRPGAHLVITTNRSTTPYTRIFDQPSGFEAFNFPAYA